MTHLTAEQFKILAGIEMTHVNYRGGTPALNDVLSGQIPMTWATVTQALPQYQAGLVRALGVTGTQRHASIPNVPTFREQGFDLVALEWYGLLAPAGTPKPIVAKLNAEMRRILALPLGERLAAIELLASPPEELGAFIRSEIDRWTPVIKKLGLKGE
jgi:tripartite-type tricarboxylate transporter receptor subunit TctC